MNILIADDHVGVRKGLIRLVEEAFDTVQVEEADNGTAVMAKLRTIVYDIALIDINMPGLNGLEVVRLAKTEGLKTPLLVLTSLPEEQYALRVIKAGASGFLGKERAAEELISLIRKIIGLS
ncbi:MAG TPA: response regulator transcription factor [Bacteroidia bacterium]|nr:response regulator transcription factor [Bacteroidia bacterium]